MIYFDDEVEKLRVKIKKGEVIFFAGAGISFNSGAPIVSQIYYQLAESLNVDKEELMSLIEGKPFESIMSILLIDENIRDHFKKLFNQKIPTATHFYLANQMAHGNTKFVITTNFDQLVEIAYQEITGRKLQVICPSDFDDFDLSVIKQHAIIKLHGCISEDLEGLGVTINAIANSKNEQRMRHVFSKLIQGDDDASILFMGYSGSDIFDIGPALRTTITDNVYIYRVKHSSLGSKKVQKLESFYGSSNGIDLECNTDELIASIWPDTIEKFGKSAEDIVHKHGWKSAFYDWKKDIECYKGLKEWEILGNLALALSGKSDIAIKYGRLALDVLEKNSGFGNPFWIAIRKNQLAQQLRTKFRESEESSLIVEAQKLAAESLQFYDSHVSVKMMLHAMRSKSPSNLFHDLSKEYCRALGILGMVLKSQGNLLHAKEIYERVIEVCLWSGDAENLGVSLMNLGHINLYLNPSQSIECYKKALQVNDKYPLALVQNHLGLCDSYMIVALETTNREIRNNFYNSAIEAARKAEEWAVKLNEPIDSIALKISKIEKLMMT